MPLNKDTLKRKFKIITILNNLDRWADRQPDRQKNEVDHKFAVISLSEVSQPCLLHRSVSWKRSCSNN